MRSVEEAFLDLLDEFLVGDGEKPTGGGWQGAHGASEFRSYLMFHPGPGVTDGPSATPDSQVVREFSVTCVARDRAGASILAQRVADTVSGQRIETPTRVTSGPITIERWGSVDRDDTVQPPVWMAVHVFRVDTVPA